MANQYICKLHGEDYGENRSFGDTLYVASVDMTPLQIAETLCANAGKDIAKYKTISPYYKDLSEMEKWEGCEMEFNGDRLHITIEKTWYELTIEIEKVNQEFIYIDNLGGE